VFKGVYESKKSMLIGPFRRVGRNEIGPNTKTGVSTCNAQTNLVLQTMHELFEPREIKEAGPEEVLKLVQEFCEDEGIILSGKAIGSVYNDLKYGSQHPVMEGENIAEIEDIKLLLESGEYERAENICRGLDFNSEMVFPGVKDIARDEFETTIS